MNQEQKTPVFRIVQRTLVDPAAISNDVLIILELMVLLAENVTCRANLGQVTSHKVTSHKARV